MNVRELQESVAHLEDSDPVPPHILVSALEWDLSYLEADLAKLEEIAGLFGRPLAPEVEIITGQIRSLL